jgi:hypothetical protein
MTGKSFTTTFAVDRPPEQTFATINDVRAWWTGDIEGDTDRLGAEFTYRYADVHRSTQRVTELVPGQRVAWRVVDADLSFARDRSEWTGTEIVFEIAPHDGGSEVRFTHHGLVPQVECFEACSTGWTMYIDGSLRRLLTSGAPAPLQA